MPEQHRHLANKCEDIVNLQRAEAYCVATRTACCIFSVLQTAELSSLRYSFTALILLKVRCEEGHPTVSH